MANKVESDSLVCEEDVEINGLAQIQEAQREQLSLRHKNELKKFHTWVEEEILAICKLGNDETSSQKQQANVKNACEYFLTKQYGKETLMNREKDEIPGNTEVVKRLLMENRALYNRQRYESEALQSQQYLEYEATGTGARAPKHEFPIVNVEEHSLEEFVPVF
eukprot:CFRG4543T1